MTSLPNAASRPPLDVIVRVAMRKRGKAAGMSSNRPNARRRLRAGWIAFGAAVLFGFGLLGIDNRWAHLVAFLLPPPTIIVALRLPERR
jgi:hypothetical protein